MDWPDKRVHDFHGLSIGYDDRVLAPRDWTAAQSWWAAELSATAPPGPLLELCAGVGHIGLLAVLRSPRPLVCVEAAPAACEWLRVNAREAGVRVDVREAPMKLALHPAERFPVIIADPPWVERDQIDRYPEDPVSAIDGGDDGLDFVRACIDIASRHLAARGSMVLQAGPTQAEGVAEAVRAAEGLRLVETRTFERGTLSRVDRVHR